MMQVQHSQNPIAKVLFNFFLIYWCLRINSQSIASARMHSLLTSNWLKRTYPFAMLKKGLTIHTAARNRYQSSREIFGCKFIVKARPLKLAALGSC